METTILSDDNLVLHLRQIRAGECQLLVEFLIGLAELDRRKLHLRLGHASLFQYLRSEERFSKAGAYRRVTAARLLALYPEIGPLLREKRLCLTTLCLLKDVLTEENHVELLARASDRTEEEVQLLVATLRPEEPTRDSVRTVAPVIKLHLWEPVTTTGVGSGPEPNSSPSCNDAKIAIVPRPLRSTVSPISSELRVLKITVHKEFIEDLERVKDALGHKVPGGKLEDVLKECIRLTLEACQKKRRGRAKMPTSATSEDKPQDRNQTRYIPASIRRQVWERDGEAAAMSEAQASDVVRSASSSFIISSHLLLAAERQRRIWRSIAGRTISSSPKTSSGLKRSPSQGIPDQFLSL